MFFKPETISESEQMNVVKSNISIEHDVFDAYYVEFITTKVVKQWGNLKTETTKLVDGLAFSTFEDAFEYGQNIEQLSTPLGYNSGKRLYTWARVYPKGFTDLHEKVKRFCPDRDLDFVNLVHAQTFRRYASIYSLNFVGNQYFDHIQETYKDAADIVEQWSKLAGNNEEIVKSVMLTEAGSYDVTTENSKLTTSRNEIIDAELDRIEKYRQFLLSMRK